MTFDELEMHIRVALTRITSRDATTIPRDADLSDAIGLDSLGRLELLADIEDLLDTFFEDTGGQDAYTIDAFLGIASDYAPLCVGEPA